MEETVFVRKQIGRNIRLLRNFKDMTIQELAESSNLSVTFLGEIERGVKCASLQTLLKLAVGLDLEPMSLLREIKNDIFPTIEANVKATQLN